MPTITFHKNGQTHVGEVQENTNLVVRAGIKQFPFPHLTYGCGMGKCAKCACRVLEGAEHLPAANWKEKKQLGERLDQGWRLACQLWINQDIVLEQTETQEVQ
ncbi:MULTISPECIES: 2Fe-2S iron-sulfur cluster-binding protein [Alcaligenes]|jgi:ferredoxin|uniref:2Fe-2S iron-sulfur cluster-binding protein n=1 Tax=Alcaligenes phenolicus TaxID=232846 RepID=A0AAW5VV46_9BURK|nr:MULTISPECIES: 2Fe-2S iron-sulfur cluster-binding protein [Alcaligenes]KVX04816.1 ferredoxin [Alcaligenes faecalis]MBW4787029.1 (2Fe-2S)-binding protein [Alcaligenes faecalis subsp. faecalis]MCX5565250.1 2Fe-2S iron-sulfur cluster-binding protein [Alcaligenes phenolicus]OSZ35139.1 ferredoxin [Alcaligenes faecalis]OSZ36708.1 ferredoxin [Alcaligenes faecalis]